MTDLKLIVLIFGLYCALTGARQDRRKL